MLLSHGDLAWSVELSSALVDTVQRMSDDVARSKEPFLLDKPGDAWCSSETSR